jgi:hypothetical protein
MLLSYSAKNFYCFKEGVEISFVLGKAGTESISNNKNITNVLGVKGANGAGKSNALKIMDFLNDFCCNSFSLKPEDSLSFKPFFNSNNPTDFTVEFEVNGIIYIYDLSIKKNKVLKESIKRKIKKEVTLFEREEDSITNVIDEFKELKKIKLRSNASIISTAHQYEIKELQFVYSFFSLIFTSINASFSLMSKEDFKTFSSYYYEDAVLLSFAKQILKKCDLGIKDIIIKKIDLDEKNVKYATYFVHEYDGKNYNIPFDDESKGTRNLYKQLFLYKLILQNSGVLVMDEFDINLHPDILPLLVDLFTDDNSNPNNAQFLFSTHSSAILDVLGKYRSILVNKKGNESFLYRLDELPGDLIRNDRPIEPLYRSGKIGGVPKV